MEKEFRKITLTFGVIMAVLGALVIWRGVTKMIPVTGWIKNCEDGVVELELQGSEEDINRFVAELEKGRYVQVEKRIVKDLPLVEDEVGFKVLE